jgi:colanic acid/amylovoran biosynthesis glycosyltransferase
MIMNDEEKPVVAHFDYPLFLPKSETFIYQYISHLERFRPVCLSWAFANLDEFPVPDRYCCLLKRKENFFKSLYYAAQRRYLSKDRSAERIAASFLRDQKARLIHAHFGTTGTLTLRLKSVLGIPHITTFYGFDISKLPRKKKWLKLYETLFQEGDLFLVEGAHMSSKLEALGCPLEKIRIQRIAIPINRITFIPRQPKKKGQPPIVIFAGRLVEKKGLIYALLALKEARSRHYNLEFRVIGDGPLKEKILEIIKKNHMSDYVRMLGLLGYTDYLKELQEADIFLHPSITSSDGDSEGGAPTTILEAQAAGLPVVSSYHADIPNIVVPGESALLCEEKDWKGLSEKIMYLIENQRLWRQIGRAGRSFVEKYHDIRQEVKTLEDKYNDLLEKLI